MNNSFERKEPQPKMPSHVIEIFFDSVSETEFCRDIDDLLMYGGLGINEVLCKIHRPDFLPSDPNVPANCVLFSIDIVDQEDIIPYEEFVDYLRAKCEGYIRRHPKDEAEIIEMLQKHKIALRP